MGLLDEAIRDHLELKRRSGADAGEIAHAERAALAPVFPDEPRPATEDDETVEGRAPAGEGSEAAAHDDAATHDPDALEAEAQAHGETAAAEDAGATLADETVEIDMRAVLAEGDAAVAAAPPALADGAEGDGFEWEVPSEGAGVGAPALAEDGLGEDGEVVAPPQQIPGQGRMRLD